MLMLGAFLSILLPLIGPAVALLPALSATLRLLVAALAFSVPLATLVERLKLASAAFARSEVASLAVQAIFTSLACQTLSAVPHATLGAVASRLMVTDWLLVPPALVAEQVKVTPVVSLF